MISDEEFRKITKWNIESYFKKWIRETCPPDMMKLRFFEALMENARMIYSNKIPENMWNVFVKRVKFNDSDDTAEIYYEENDTPVVINDWPKGARVLSFKNGVFVFYDKKEEELIWMRIA